MFKRIRKSSLHLVLISSLAFFAGCSDIENTGSNVVGDNFVSAEVIDDVSALVMLGVVKATINPIATNAFGYKAVKINYMTEDQSGSSVEASGLLVIPTATEAYQAYRISQGEQPFSVSMLCDNHGTIFTDAEAPSNVEVSNGMPDYSLAVLATGYAGFAAVLPDYIGYGTSNAENHPYMLKKASARASLDMIRASVRYMTDTNVVFNSQLYISGYSQGGYTAMALAELIESSYDNEFTLKGIAPMAGPYDLEALGNIEINATHTMMYPAFLGYLANSYSQTYSDVVLSDVIVETNTTMYQSLFDGSKTNVEIHGALGLTINGGFGVYTADALFKTDYIDDYQNNLNNALRVRLQENKSYSNWTPSTKMNLIHCVDDEIIPFSMSQNAFNELNATGADVTLSPIPSSVLPGDEAFVHADCGSTAYGVAVGWFADIRSGVIQ